MESANIIVPPSFGLSRIMQGLNDVQLIASIMCI